MRSRRVRHGLALAAISIAGAAALAATLYALYGVAMAAFVRGWEL